MRKTSIRRALAWVLVLVMTLSAVPFGVLAEGTTEAPVCVCSPEGDKCTPENPNQDCPVCAAEDADLDKCCLGKPQEEPKPESEVKKPADEEAAKKAADEEAAKKAAEEEAARKASEEAVQALQDKINTLPDPDTINAENRQAVEKALTEIDDAKLGLTDEERAALDFIRYDAAVEALNALDGMTGAGVAATLDEPEQITAEITVTWDKDDFNASSFTDSTYWYVEVSGGGITGTKRVDPTDGNSVTIKEKKLSDGSYTLTVKGKKDGKALFEHEFTWNQDLQQPVKYYTTKWTVAASFTAYCSDNRNARLENASEIEKILREDISQALPYGYKEVSLSFEILMDPNSKVMRIFPCVEITNGSTSEEKNSFLDAYYSELKLDICIENLFSQAGKMYRFTCNNGENYYRNDYHLYLENFRITDDGFLGYKFEEVACRTISYYKFYNDDKSRCIAYEQIADSQYEHKLTRTTDLPGYIFRGWSTDGTIKGKIETVTLTGDINLYAIWEPVKITLDDGGTQKVLTIEEKEIKQGDSLPTPEKPGYTFEGWFNAKGEKIETADFGNGDIESYTLTARWTRTKPTVDGNSIAVNLTDEEHNAILGKDSEVLTIRNRVSTDKSILSELGLEENSKMIAVDVDLLRNGDENKKITDLSHTIWFAMDASKLSLNKLQVARKHNGTWSFMTRLTAKPTDGQTEGYYLDGNTLYIYSKQFSTFAAYSAYTVTFDAQGGQVTPQSAKTDANDTLTSLPTPTRTGYTFGGWYLTEDCSGEELDTTHVYTDDTTVYAKWSPVTYTVTFHANYPGDDTTSTQDFTYDQTQKLDCGTGIQRQFYKLSGWAETTDGEKKYEANESVKNLGTAAGTAFRGKDLYAVWEYVPRTVTFDANGLDENGKPTKGTVTENGTEKATVTRKTQEVPLNTLKALPVPDAQEGYFFDGWYYKDSANKEQPVKIGVTVFEADTAVYAKWKVFEPVTVTLKCQKGTLTLDGKTVSETTMQTKWPGVIDGTLPTPARTGYKFQGWYTAAGVKVDENTVFLQDTTLYARWTSALSRTGNPKTGDQVMLEAAVAVLIVAAVGICVTLVVMKKKGKK